VHVPTAMQILADKQALVTCARRLTSAVTDALLERLLRTFALNELRSVVGGPKYNFSAPGTADVDTCASASAPSVTSPPNQASAHGSEQALSPSEPSAYAQASRQAPWKAWIPEAETNDLSIEKKILLGVALMLRRAAAVVRTHSFATALQQWRRWETVVQAKSPAVSLEIITTHQAGAHDHVSGTEPAQDTAALATPRRAANSLHVP